MQIIIISNTLEIFAQLSAADYLHCAIDDGRDVEKERKRAGKHTWWGINLHL